MAKRKVKARKVKGFDHKELRLSYAELGALLGTREMLRTKTLKDAHGRSFADDDEHLFNMGDACVIYVCGSVACIGGTMAQIMGKNASEAMRYVASSSGKLRELFFPKPPKGSVHDLDYDKIKPTEAVVAIDNFLKDKVSWSKTVLERIKDKA
jgi:hypothetical protein